MLGIEINAGVVVVLLFLILVLLRVPVFIALAFPPILYLIFTGQSTEFASQRVIRTIDSFTLLAIPLFIFGGSLMNHGEITDVIFDFMNEVVGHLTGGLAQVNIYASVVFSGISGSALADVGGLGRILIDTMSDHGYQKPYAAALTSSSATIGPIFPPSVPLVLYGLYANVSVVALLLAGIIPAIVTAILLSIGTYFLARRRDFPKADKRVSMPKMVRAFIKAIPALGAPVVLIGGMMSGYFGPTAAAAAMIFYMVLINTFVYRKLSFGYIWDAGLEAAKTTSIVMILLAAAALFSWVMTIERVDETFATMLFSISTNVIVVLILVNIFLLLIGMVIDPLAGLLMAVPLVVPPLETLGMDPVHIGIFMVFNLMLGLLTPPLGLSIFIASDISGEAPERIFRELPVYYGIMLVALLLIVFVPELSLYILNFF